MKGLIKKVRENKKGFTLAELLVVVAIVGILVAISIPVFTAQLSKARKATNQANLRAAKAAAIADYLTDEMDTNATGEVTYNYDMTTGGVKVVGENNVTQRSISRSYN
ncbi:MAG: prepilin-type N-terminal cleavage/methylation domain-containing protein [Clostridium sp.]